MKVSQLLNLSVSAALEAGSEIMEIYSSDSIEVEIKEDDSLISTSIESEE